MENNADIITTIMNKAALQFKNTEFRWGQCIMNITQMNYPHIANHVIGTDKDPFYKDENIERFINYVVENTTWK